MATEDEKCGTCDGTKAVARDGGFDACPTCQGTWRPSDELIASARRLADAAVGVDRSGWSPERIERVIAAEAIAWLADRLETEQLRIVSESIPKELLAEVIREEVALSPNAVCVQCGVQTLKTDVNHWEVCEKHPARAVVAALLDLVARAPVGSDASCLFWRDERAALLAKHGRTS